jgi:uncharacterized OB-fold protein
VTAEVVDGVWDRPVPGVDAVSAPYFRACARGELLVQRCPECGHRQHYPRAMCGHCAAEPDWEPVSGLGTVYTYTVIRQMGASPFRDELPYVVAMIELDEGVRMMSNVTGCAPGDVSIGMPVEVYMVMAGPDVAVPFFRPRRS